MKIFIIGVLTLFMLSCQTAEVKYYKEQSDFYKKGYYQFLDELYEMKHPSCDVKSGDEYVANHKPKNPFNKTYPRFIVDVKDGYALYAICDNNTQCDTEYLFSDEITTFCRFYTKVEVK